MSTADEPAIRRAQLLAAAADCSHDAIFAVRSDGTIAVANLRAQHVLGVPARELENRRFASLFDRPAADAVEERLRAAAGGADVFQHDTVARHPHRRGVDVTLNMAPLRDDQGAAAGGVSVIIQDITARKAHERELREVADRDDLTDMLNRRRFVVELDRMLRASSRRTDRDAALVLVDIDRFKDVNDRDGHLAGDELLRVLAATFARSLRASDLAARLGGDEFAVLVANVSREDAVRATEKLQAATRAALARWDATTSAGVVHFGEVEPLTADGALEEADRRLYRAKAAGGNVVVAHGP